MFTPICVTDAARPLLVQRKCGSSMYIIMDKNQMQGAESPKHESPGQRLGQGDRNDPSPERASQNPWYSFVLPVQGKG
jgi:hypothetical protein